MSESALDRGIVTPLAVLIAEDQYLLREGTRRLLEETEGVEVVGTAFDYDRVLWEARRLRRDVVLMDIKMPPSETVEGIEAAHAIKVERLATGVLVLSQHDDESYVWALLEKGVEGYGYLHKLRVGDIDHLLAPSARSRQAGPWSTRAFFATFSGKTWDATLEANECFVSRGGGQPRPS